jgi:hypothetical protein
LEIKETLWYKELSGGLEASPELGRRYPIFLVKNELMYIFVVTNLRGIRFHQSLDPAPDSEKCIDLNLDSGFLARYVLRYFRRGFWERRFSISVGL